MEVRYLPCGRKTGRHAIMFNLGFEDNFRSQFGQQQQQPFDFKALDARLGKMETGIASLTDQFRDLSPGPSPLEVEPTPAGIESLGAPQPAAPEPLGGIESLVPLEGQPTSSLPGGASSQSLSRSGPLSITQKLQNEYLMETKGPLTMGNEWDARAKEMGFDFAEQRRQGHKGRLSSGSSGWDETHRFNKLFEEAGGVLDRPEMGAAARYGEGFTNWLGDKGYEVYTEPQQEWMTQLHGLAGLSGFEQDTSGIIPHLSQYAMTAEEMQDPTGTLAARRLKLYQPSGDVDVGGISGFEELERLRGGKLNQDITNWSNFQQQGGIGPTTRQPVDPNALAVQYSQRFQRPNQQLQALYNDPSLMAAGIAGQPSLRGPTQQKIQQGIGALV